MMEKLGTDELRQKIKFSLVVGQGRPVQIAYYLRKAYYTVQRA